jgi:hypothetical protein
LLLTTQAKAKDAKAKDAKAKGTKVASVAFAFCLLLLLAGLILLAAGWAMYSPACRLLPAPGLFGQLLLAVAKSKGCVVKSKGA